MPRKGELAAGRENAYPIVRACILRRQQKVVSERLVQRASAAMRASLRPPASCTTASGLPPKGSEEKTFTWAKGSLLIIKCR